MSTKIDGKQIAAEIKTNLAERDVYKRQSSTTSTVRGVVF